MRIAHISDLHILDPRTVTSGSRYRFATRAVSLGRAIDPASRARKLARALAAAKAARASHVVISGDLTELGHRSEFEYLARVLEEAKLPAGSVTMVPGNHDAYTGAGEWSRALEGPLSGFREASAEQPGKVVERDDVVVLPIDSSYFQTIARSAGRFTEEAARAVERRLLDPAFAHKSIVLVLHHPPFAHDESRIWQWVDGLRGYRHLLELLLRHPRVQILHGHLHKALDRFVGIGKDALLRVEDLGRARTSPYAKARIFGAPATVEDREEARVRLYDVLEGSLESVSLGEAPDGRAP